MSWPTPQDYNEAVQNPAANFRDTELQRGTVELTRLGLPRPITGNFASVYQVTCGSQRYAVRCFWREYGDMRERYAAISTHLQAAALPYTVPFEYQPEGIRVRGTWYPLLKMQWVEGQLLHDYLRANLRSVPKLERLQTSWVEFCERLKGAGVSHGDLQHGNILVVNDELKLVDYDGMYVPALAGKQSHELGHQNYQHPRRSASDFGPTMDRFSCWVIWLSIAGLSVEPDLWHQLSAGDECLLLRKSDFEQPQQSEAIRLLQALPEDGIAEGVKDLRRFAGATMNVVPPLSSAARSSGAGVLTGPALARKLLHRTLLPGPIFPAQEEDPSSAARAPWWEEHLAHDAPPDTPTNRTSFVAAPLLGFAFGLVVFASVGSLVVAGVAALVLVITAFSSLSVIGYRAEPLVQAHLVGWKEQRRNALLLLRLKRELWRVRKKLEAGLRKEERDRRRLEGRVRQLNERYQERRQAVVEVTEEVSRILVESREAVRAERDQAVKRALDQRREQHVNTALGQQSIWQAPSQRLSRFVKLKLWLQGMRTAKAIEVDRLREAGLAEDQVAALLAWRLLLQREARADLPTRLEQRISERVEKPFTRRMDHLEGQRERVTREAAGILGRIAELEAVMREEMESALAERAASGAVARSSLEQELRDLEQREAGTWEAISSTDDAASPVPRFGRWLAQVFRVGR